MQYDQEKKIFQRVLLLPHCTSRTGHQEPDGTRMRHAALICCQKVSQSVVNLEMVSCSLGTQGPAQCGNLQYIFFFLLAKEVFLQNWLATTACLKFYGTVQSFVNPELFIAAIRQEKSEKEAQRCIYSLQTEEPNRTARKGCQNGLSNTQLPSPSKQLLILL